MYFKKMPKILYPTKNGQIITKDIFRRVALNGKETTKAALNTYYINDGDTPENVAYNFYGSAEYHWIILIANKIINVSTEWPKNSSDIFAYVEDKYGAGNATEIHHYRITGSDPEIIVDYDSAKVADGTHVGITNFDYEIEVNESKRQIELIKPEFLKDFITTYTKLMAS
jgi:hypothetical protein